jgi:cytochrome c peroxidase
MSQLVLPQFIVTALWAAALTASAERALSAQAHTGEEIDQALTARLQELGFTGRIGSSVPERLGRPIDPVRADLGRLLWFDTIIGLHDDNTCAGCHSPSRGFGDTQSIAIGIDNNGIVGPHRTGPRNQRRTPMAINAALYPNLMWNSRFASLADDPFDNALGFQFPPPEGLTLSDLPHLLVAQAFIPPTERTEAAGFEFVGDNDAIRAEVLRRLNGLAAYRTRFGEIFPEVKRGARITFQMLGAAVAEFEFTLIFADAPIDEFARGNRNALTTNQKVGALLFFGQAGCVQCHSVSGPSNEMFSDFKQHVIGVPQIAPTVANVVFDGPGQNEDFGLEQVTGREEDRYAFRTAPLRNVALQPAFFHNGCFTRLEDAIRHHLNVWTSARTYNPVQAGVAVDLAQELGPIEPVLARVDSLLDGPILLSELEFKQLVEFVRVALLDKRAGPDHLRKLVPDEVPSGRSLLVFEFAGDRPKLK